MLKRGSTSRSIFCGLVSAQQLKGLRLGALSGFNAYDGLVDIDTTSNNLNDPHDPLSIRTSSPKREGEMRVVEFKHVFESVLEDFESNKKDPKDIDIMICWDLPNMAVRRGSFDYWYADKIDLREVYGATHVWRDDNNSTDIVVISLKHVVATLIQNHETKKAKPGIGTAKLAELLSQDKQSSL